MIKRKLTIGLLLLVALCMVFTPAVVMAATSGPGTASGTLGDINEITVPDAEIAFAALTPSTGDNTVLNSAADKLQFSTTNSNIPVFWKGEVTGATCPSGTDEATVKPWIYWSDASSEEVYPALIDVTTGWDVNTATIPTDGGNETKSAAFTVNYHAWTDGNGEAASSATHRVVFTDSNKVFVKEGATDWDFTSTSDDLTADATALQVSTGDGEKNFLLASDSEPIGDAVYVLTVLNTGEGSEQVTFQMGNKYAYTGSAQTGDFYAMVDIPNLSPAGAYTWTITVTTVKWDSN